jgi:dye decolorizing peroxidase
VGAELGRRSLLRGGLLVATGAAVGAAGGVAGGAALASALGTSLPDGASAGSGGSAASAGGAAGGTAGGAGAGGVPGSASLVGSGGLGAAVAATPAAGRQPGVDTPPGAHAVYRAFALRAGTDATRLRGWLALLGDDIERLMSGRPVLGDVEPELGEAPASLTITLALGREAVRRAGVSAPAWLAPLPSYKIDALEERWGEADVLLQLTCDDPLTLAHADRVLQRESAPFATLAWVQEGFRYARGARADGTTMRNLFGQVDGTSNPAPGSEEFDAIVYRSGDGPFGAGSTSLVLRRIAMDLDTWDEVDRSAREDAVGRTLKDGGPITGGAEADEVDLAAEQGGWPVVADFAHVRRARPAAAGEKIYRRGFNYNNPGASGSERAGLLFVSFQADPMKQFHPIQARLAELDMLNEWTTPVGSCVFWVPPASSRSAADGGFPGDVLFA